MSQQPLTNLGIIMPPNFPSASYDAITITTNKLNNSYAHEWGEFVAGWKGVGTRFIAFDHSKTAFIKAIASSATSQDLVDQDRELFSFIITGLSTLECNYYSLYTLGAILDPTIFPFTDADKRRISIETTIDKYLRAFPGHQINQRIDIRQDRNFQDIKEWRNLLVHRMSPNKIIYLTVGTPPQPAQWNINNSLVLNAQKITDLYDWIVITLNSIVNEINNFTQNKFP